MQCNHVRNLSLLALAILILSFLASCGQAEIYLGWMASNRPGHMRACYAAFGGSKVRTVQANTGETLVVEYDATVNKGILAISVEGPDDEIVWVVSLDQDSKNSVELPVEQEGRWLSSSGGMARAVASLSGGMWSDSLRPKRLTPLARRFGAEWEDYAAETCFILPPVY